MKRNLLFAFLAVAFLCSALAFTYTEVKESEAEKEIKALVLKSYVNGAFNDLDPDAMRKGFHPDFAIFSADGENISKYPIDKWAAYAEKTKSDPEFDPSKNVWKHNFAHVDVTGGSAIVKIELSHEGKHVYTDYLSLLKFDSGWRIVAKVYHKH